MIRSFTEWLASEKDDVFGFDRRAARNVPVKAVETDDPVHSFSNEFFLSELSSYSLGSKQPKWEWADHIEWGTGEAGTIRLQISPFGSNEITIRKKMNDLTGVPIWICKKVVPFSSEAGYKESILAQDILEDLKKLDAELLEMPDATFASLEELVVSLGNRAAIEAPLPLIYNGIRMLEENAYTIYFSLTGHGVEAPGSRQVEQFNIDVSYSPRRGTIRCFGYDVSSPKSGHKWEPQPSQWDEIFVPTQPRKEIEDAIMNVLSTY